MPRLRCNAETASGQREDRTAGEIPHGSKWGTNNEAVESGGTDSILDARHRPGRQMERVQARDASTAERVVRVAPASGAPGGCDAVLAL